MQKKVIHGEFSVAGIESIIKELKAYKNSLPIKCKTFADKLADAGISVAKGNVGNMGKYIAFSKTNLPSETGCKALVLATQTGIIKSEWRTKEGVKSADVSPLLMAEFGSGFKAKNPAGIAGVGQGTFPGQTHAFDKEGWWYMDLNGKWHHSFGVEPKAPMYKASIHMEKVLVTIAREVFGGD